MENERIPLSLAFIEQLRPFAKDEASYGRVYADLRDLLEASSWLLATAAGCEGRSLQPDEIETLLIEIDVKFVQHVSFHIKSLSRELESMLKRFPDDAG
ncbi:hypothetical protein HLB44_19350 [Aquincola sp. S2]|uniref:Transposase n=1 Tax=Pseudaquabacterium terrae TaxID=2732868 RepID=A0ABX2EKJ7_9BURK|nr:hypothetical protein [Aquabacterium terrae]NRF69155.1 hypothetical protein [Aquabacterium terrae]